MNDETGESSVTLDGTWSGDLTAAPTPAAPTAPPHDHTIRPEGLADRYIDLGEIARGGMGAVHRVHDRMLGRPLVMKVMHWRLFEDAAARARFLREVGISARLQHPGVVPVQDVGELPDGRLWFTMKEVDGRTFGALVAAVHTASTPAAWGETADGWSLRRLVEALLRITQTVAYAHREGVVHRDLKPDNLMIGAFGEVMVMDWGIARRLDVAEPPEVDAFDAAPGTSVVGTPAYMAPEQARGELPTPAVDVYALGGVLYHLLSGHRPLDTGGSPFAVLYHRPRPLVAAPTHHRDDSEGAAAIDAIGAIDAIDAIPPLPAALVELCHAALAPDPADRPDVDAFAAGLRRWLDGEARRARARALVDDAAALRPRITALREEAAALDAEADALLADVPPHAPLDHKTPAWRRADDARARRRAAREAELTLVQTLRQALEADPDAADARAMLTDHYRGRLLDAEARRDPEHAADAAAQLRLHDPVGSAQWLRGDGALTLVTDPPGATVELFRIHARARRHVPVRVGALPETPLRAHPLAPGSYLLVLRAPGRAAVRYPVRIGRGEHWHGIPPGETEPHPIQMPPTDAIGPDEIYVPAGWTTLGGDDEAADPLPRQRVWLDGYVIARLPTTNADYIEFLDALVAAGREADALRWAPAGRSADDGAYIRTPDGRFGVREVFGFVWRLDHPVIRLRWAGADAYARWRAARDGLGWRLPEEHWLERAARGVDERRYAMGDHLDPTFACIAESHPATPVLAPVGGFPLDESVYGIRGLTGNARVFCSTPYRRGGAPIVDGRPDFAEVAPITHRVVRGGTYVTQRAWCSAASRFALPPDVASSNVGIRLCRPWPP